MSSVVLAEREMTVEKIFGDLKYCTSCILPETFPGIEFDENGVCNHGRYCEPIKVFG